MEGTGVLAIDRIREVDGFGRTLDYVSFAQIKVQGR
jgi:hypothetical protein